MPKSKRTLIIFIMFIISLLLMLQFGSGLRLLTKQSHPKPGDEEQGPPLSVASREGQSLKIDVSLPQAVFEELKGLTQQFQNQHGIIVELNNRDEHELNHNLERSLALEQSADVIMIPSEQVKSYATKGRLLPHDPSAHMWGYSPDWLNELISWNGYVWGIPSYMDPYVLVWNPVVLKERIGLEQPPATWKEWNSLLKNELAKKPGEIENIQPVITRWFTWNEQEPYALLSLLWRTGAIFPLRDDQPREYPVLATQDSQTIHTHVSPYWQENLAQWASYRSLFQPVIANTEQSIWKHIDGGTAIFAIVPYSEAAPRLHDRLSIEMPRDISQPYGTWMRSMSYVIPSYTTMEAEARQWIKYVTAPSLQQDLMEDSFLLPASRTAYDQILDLWDRQVPSIYHRSDVSLKQALRHSSALAGWARDAYNWLQDDLKTEVLAERFRTIWTLP